MPVGHEMLSKLQESGEQNNNRDHGDEFPRVSCAEETADDHKRGKAREVGGKKTGHGVCRSQADRTNGYQGDQEQGKPGESPEKN